MSSKYLWNCILIEILIYQLLPWSAKELKTCVNILDWQLAWNGNSGYENNVTNCILQAIIWMKNRSIFQFTLMQHSTAFNKWNSIDYLYYWKDRALAHISIKCNRLTCETQLDISTNPYWLKRNTATFCVADLWFNEECSVGWVEYCSMIKFPIECPQCVVFVSVWTALIQINSWKFWQCVGIIHIYQKQNYQTLLECFLLKR